MDATSKYIPLLSRWQVPLISRPLLFVQVSLLPTLLVMQAACAACGTYGSGGGGGGGGAGGAGGAGRSGGVGIAGSAGGAGNAGNAGRAGGAGTCVQRPRSGQRLRSLAWLDVAPMSNAANNTMDTGFMIFSWWVNGRSNSDGQLWRNHVQEPCYRRGAQTSAGKQ